MADALVPSILAVGLGLPGEPQRLSLTLAHTGREALHCLRLMQWDLLLASRQLPDMPVWTLIEKVRRVRPWQKWGLIASDLGEDDERLARVLGATLVLDEMPSLDELLGSARRMNHAEPRRTALLLPNGQRRHANTIAGRPRTVAGAALRATT